jgi:hypothetical protein
MFRSVKANLRALIAADRQDPSLRRCVNLSASGLCRADRCNSRCETARARTFPGRGASASQRPGGNQSEDFGDPKIFAEVI